MAATKRRAHKYNAIKTEVDGVRFDSKKEARRWCELRLLEQSGEISQLERQRKFDLVVNGIKICTYRADFVYKNKNGELVVEDTKGYITAEFRLKWKLLAAVHPSMRFLTS
jgi:Protein of unknown function (DUF1064)